MPVPSPHFLGGVSHEFIDQALVDSFRSKIADERMPQTVPAVNHLPLAVLERSLKMIVCLISG